MRSTTPPHHSAQRRRWRPDRAIARQNLHLRRQVNRARNPNPGRVLEIFTDGSVLNDSYGGCAFAFFDDTLNMHTSCGISLGENKTVPEAEKYGIKFALEYVLGEELENVDEVLMRCDSVDVIWDVEEAWISKPKNDIMAVGVKTVDGLVADSMEELKGKGVKTSFLWIKGHAGNKGNWIADAMALRAAQESQDGKGMGEWRKWKEFK